MRTFDITKDDSVLVIVDIQEKLVPAMPEGQRVIANCLNLIELAKLYNIPILVTEQYPKGLGHTIPKIKDALPDYNPTEKISFSCCRDDSFLARLRESGRTNVILTGMEAHVCVLQTCLDLLTASYNVHLVNDAVCSRAENNFSSGVELMRDAGTVITCTETVLFQLLKKAGSDEFKAISKRIK